MVSAQIGGTYKLYIENPAGTRRLVASANAYWWGPGGSSVGVIANTPEKWNALMPSADTGAAGYKIVLTVTSGGAATADASDGAYIIPVMIANGAGGFSTQNVGNPAHASGLGNDNFTVDLTPADSAFVAGVETPYMVIRAKEGVRFKVGGGRVFLSVEDNA